MIGVVLSMLRARPAQAVVLVVLSALATAAAVAGPAYLAATDRAVIAAELAGAARSEFVVSAAPREIEWQVSPGELDVGSQPLTAFRRTMSLEVPVVGIGGRPTLPDRLVYRQGFCDHLVIVAGRCPLATFEVAVPAELADAGWPSVGSTVDVTASAVSATGAWEPAGPVTQLRVVGIYRPLDPRAAYWGAGNYFGGDQRWTVFTSRPSIQWLQHAQTQVFLDAVLDPARVSPETLPQVRDELRTAAAELDLNNTDVSRLLDRIERGRAPARQLVPLGVVPLVGLCWFVIYLAVSYGVAARRQEVGLLALRGSRAPYRGVLVAAEAVLPVLAGVPFGLLLGQAAVAATGAVTLAGAAPFGLGAAHWAGAGVAAAGSVAVVLLAQRRELTAPVAQLLRRVPSRTRWSATVAEVLAVVLAAATVVQLRAFGGQLVGVALLVPALVVLAVALVAGRLAAPVVRAAGRRALHRGRLGRAVAAQYLGRHPGGLRLLVVLALVLGTVGFAAVAVDVAAQTRAVAAQRILGAPRVLTLDSIGPRELLAAVETADPTGLYAMAAVPLASPSETDPPRLAVDTSRLARVAIWPQTADVDVTGVVEALRPPPVGQVWLRDGQVETRFTANTAATVTLLLEPSGTDRWLSITLATVRAGPTARYLATVEGCADGCRLVGLSLNLSDLDADEVEITWDGLHRDGRPVVPPEALTDPERWQVRYNGPIHGVHLTGGEDGLTFSIPSTAGLFNYRILTVDAPLPLPVVTGAAGAGGLRGEMAGMDGIPVEIAPAGTVTGVPWLPEEQVLVDLRYAALLAEPTGRAAAPQVWLAAGTPERIVRELEAAGLVVLSDRSLPDVHTLLDRSGPAVALRFQLLVAGLAAALGIGALALVAAVDRRGWGGSLRTLRTQGVSRRTVRAAALWAYGWVVVAATVIGAGAAVAAWWAAGDRLPMVVGEPVPVPAWPRWEPVLTGWLGAAAALIAAALVAAWWLSRHVAGGAGRAGGAGGVGPHGAGERKVGR